MKKNLILVIAVLLLGAVAIFTGVKIYQTREEPVTPTQPKGVTEECRLVLEINVPTLTPTLTPEPTTPLTPTPTPTPIPECWHTCLTSNDCPQDLNCQIIEGQKRCVNAKCPGEEDCQCPAPTSTPTTTPLPTATLTPLPVTVTTQPTSAPLTQLPTATPTPPTELPEAGSFWPTLGVTIGGIILGIIGLFLAF